MKLPKGAFRFSVDRALWVYEMGGHVVIEDLKRVSIFTGKSYRDEWLPPSGNDNDGIFLKVLPQRARVLVRLIVKNAERAAAWKRAAKVMRSTRPTPNLRGGSRR